MMAADHAPTRPRKASAGTRRHHLKYVTYRIRQLVPGAHTVILLPVDVFGAEEQEFAAVVRDRAGVQLKLQEGASRRLASLLQGAFVADWAQAQTWRADTNRLHVWAPPTANFIDTDAAGYIESLDQYDARLAKAGA